MSCTYDPRYTPTHQGLMDCPECKQKVLAGHFHLDHENPLTAEFIKFMGRRPEVLPIDSGFQKRMKTLEEWVDEKGRYITALACGDRKLKPRKRYQGRVVVEVDL